MGTGRLESKLRAISEELKRISDRLGSPSPGPRILTRRMAATQLSVSINKLSVMIGCGEILTVQVGKRTMIPASEIERLSEPAPLPKRAPDRNHPTHTVVDMAARARARIKAL